MIQYIKQNADTIDKVYRETRDRLLNKKVTGIVSNLHVFLVTLKSRTVRPG
jgi:hypothetical protein